MEAKRIVAFVMNELTDYSYELSAGAESVLAVHGYQSMVIAGKHLDDPASKAHNLIYQALHTDRFVGALFYTLTLENSSSPTVLPKLLTLLADRPVVSIGAKLAACSSIITAQETGMWQLMEHLLAQNRYQRFLFVRGLANNVDSLSREKIFRAALQRQQRLAQTEFITGGFNGDVVYKEIFTRLTTATATAVPSLVTHQPTPLGATAMPPTVIVCANDRMAIAAIEAVHDAGLRVPDDVAVTGFDNSPECQKSKVPLTTIGQPLWAMGEQAAEMLIDLIAGKPVADYKTPTQLIVRASSGMVNSTATTVVESPAANGDKLPQAAKAALKQREYLSHLVMDLNIKLMGKNTLLDLQQELLTLLPRLGIRCCFISLYEKPKHIFGAPVRLFLAYDEADPELAQTFPTAPFDSSQLLPAALLTDERLGSLCELTALVIGTEIYGYMLFSWTAHYFTDFLALPIVISGALRNIYQLQGLQEYAGTLEHKVEERTRELRAINRRLQHEVQERKNSEAALRMANEQLQRLATIDGLTQLDNRTTLDTYLWQQCQRQARIATPFSLFLSDVDCFKKYNDTYGHLAGDECLRAIARVFKAIAHQHGGIAARYGGEEFALALPNCAEHKASAIAEQIMNQVATLQIAHMTSIVAKQVTLSLGIATIRPGQVITREELVARADGALYWAKFTGRHRYTCYHEHMAALSQAPVAYASAPPVDLLHPETLARSCAITSSTDGENSSLSTLYTSLPV